MHVIFVEWDINLVPCKIQINNLNVMEKLAHVNNIVVSRSSMLSE